MPTPFLHTSLLHFPCKEFVQRCVSVRQCVGVANTDAFPDTSSILPAPAVFKAVVFESRSQLLGAERYLIMAGGPLCITLPEVRRRGTPARPQDAAILDELADVIALLAVGGGCAGYRRGHPQSVSLPRNATCDRQSQNSLRLASECLQQVLLLFLGLEMTLEWNQPHPSPHTLGIVSDYRLVVKRHPQLMRWFKGERVLVVPPRGYRIASRNCFNGCLV